MIEDLKTVEKIERLVDDILQYIKNDRTHTETSFQIKERFGKNYSEKEIELALEYLFERGFVSRKNLMQGDKILHDKYAYYISVKGLLFFLQGGLNQENITLNKKKSWIRAKTIAATLNAISILAIASIGVLVSHNSNLKDAEINKLKTEIDSLKNIRSTQWNQNLK